MNRIGSIVVHELLSNFRRRSYLLLTFGVPLLAIIAVLVIILVRAGREDEPEDPLADLPDKPAGYVDHSGLFENPGVYAPFFIPYETEAEAAAAVEAGELSSYYLIPKDYLATGQITRASLQFNLIESDMALLESFLVATLLEDDSPYLLARLESPAYFVEHQLSQSGELVTEIEGSSMSNFALVYGFALIMMMTTLWSSSQLMSSVVEEKENRVIEIVLSSVRPMQILAGKVIGQGLSGLINIGAWLAGILVIVQITGAEVPLIGTIDLPLSTYLVALLYFIGGYLLFAAFASGIGAISVNMREGPQYSVVYSLPAVVPLIFMPSIMEAPNGALAVALSLIPICAPLGMMERIVVTVVPVWQIVLSLFFLFATVLGTLWLSSRLFRVNTLLAGNLPKPRELIQLLIRG